MGLTLTLTFRDLQQLESSYTSPEEEGRGEVLRRINNILQGNCHKGGNYSFLLKAGLTRVERLLLLAKKTRQNLGVQCPQLHQGLPIHPHANFQDLISCLSTEDIL